MATKELATIEPKSLAAQLWGIEQELERLTEVKDEIRDKLLESLQSQSVKFIRLDNGDSYSVAERQTLKVKDVAKAEKWAEDNSCWKLDTTKILKIVRRELKMPKFFGIESKQYLTIKRAKGDEADE